MSSSIFSFRSLKIFAISYLLLCGVSSNAKDLDLSYPELSMVPRASEMVMEAAKDDGKWSRDFQLLIPSVMTFLSGSMAQGDLKSDTAATQQMAQIATWLGAGATVGYALSTIYYRPYQEAAAEASSSKGTSVRDQLILERASEESLRRPARLYNTFKWISVAALATSSASLVSVTNENTAAIASISALSAFLPLIFEHPFQAKYRLYKNYRKRIYGPVSAIQIGAYGEAQMGMKWSF